MADTPTCAHCRRPLGPRFEVRRFDGRGEERGIVNVCSLICLCQWAYGAAVRHGVAGVIGMKDALSNLAAMFRGGPKR